MQARPAGVFEVIVFVTIPTNPFTVALVIVETPATPELARTIRGEAVRVKLPVVDPIVAAITRECEIAPEVAVAVTVKLPARVPLMFKVEAPEPAAMVRRVDV